MNCYVLGAGVSKSVNYPLGSELFDAIDQFVRQSGPCIDRFDYQKDWEDLTRWLEGNPNPTIAQAYRTRNIEHLFTVLDFADELRNDALLNTFHSRASSKLREKKAEAFGMYDRTVEDYGRFRRILLWALEHYFSQRHCEDVQNSKDPNWDALRAFGNSLAPGDVVITFNYDATVERVLLGQGRWSPRDGYGFEIVFQQSRDDRTVVDPWGRSAVTVLHVHGATGWYRRPFFAPGYVPQGSRAVPFEVFGAAPAQTQISLDPEFLTGLGIFNAVDACLPDKIAVPHERHVVLHPSFLKDYLSDEGVIAALWQRAAEALRRADRVFIVGYSLPKADSAALTLLLTSCADGRARIINPHGGTKVKLGSLLHTGDSFQGTAYFEDWALSGCPERIPWKPREKEAV